jgi:hypothetical protein
MRPCQHLSPKPHNVYMTHTSNVYTPHFSGNQPNRDVFSTSIDQENNKFLVAEVSDDNEENTIMSLNIGK